MGARVTRLVSRKLFAFALGCALLVALVVLRADPAVQQAVAVGVMAALPVVIGAQGWRDVEEAKRSPASPPRHPG